MKREKSRVKDYDQFQLRLPPGMRGRIKERAEEARLSMNEAIVWALEKEFPVVETLDDRIEELASLVSKLRDTENPNAAVEKLIAEMEAMIAHITTGRIIADTNFTKMVSERADYWKLGMSDTWHETFASSQQETTLAKSDAKSGSDDVFDVANDFERAEGGTEELQESAKKDGKT